jgi:hypothetical protein
MLQLNFFDLIEGFNLMAFGDMREGLGGWQCCGFVPQSQEMLANSPWWHHKSGFSSLKHGGRQMLGFKSECLNPKHEE